jgi:hypothetical protein
MLSGELTGLRARTVEDVGILGMTRGSSWVNGRFCDDVIFGLLAEEFTG